jgi:hypothetical protein
MQPTAGKIKYDDFNKTDFGQCPLLALLGSSAFSAKRVLLQTLDFFR